MFFLVSVLSKKMSEDKQKELLKMSDIGFEDVVSILLGVSPEGEEIVVYEGGEEAKSDEG